MQKGITLIETVIYIALFSIILSGLMFSAFNIFEGGEKNEAHINLQEEGNFLLSKINNAINGYTNISVLSNELTVTKSYLPANESPIIIRKNGLFIEIKRGGGSFIKLNNTNTELLALNFTISSPGTQLESIKTQFTLKTRTANGLDYTRSFELQKNLRK